VDQATTTFACLRCDEPFERVYTVGRKPQYCESCRTEIRLTAGRAYMAAAYIKRVPGAPESFTCKDCQEPFEYTRTSGRTPERCRPCQAKRNNAKTAEARRINGRKDLKFLPGERIYPCTECGADIPCATTGRKPECCKSCAKRRTVKRVAVRQKRPPRAPINCIDCNVLVELPIRGASRQKRCAECAVKAARVIQKRMSHERRALKMGAEAEKFTHLEIFERDAWKCGICKKRINKHLKHPHPMSASLDHIIPLTRGGSHTRAGVQASHLRCNLRKYNLGGGEQLMLVG
jgi:hypothetical protein